MVPSWYATMGASQVHQGAVRALRAVWPGFSVGIQCVSPTTVPNRVGPYGVAWAGSGSRLPDIVGTHVLINEYGRRLTVCRNNDFKARHEKFYILNGFSGTAQFKVFSCNFVNSMTSVYERVFFHEVGGVFERPQRPAPGVVNQLLRRFARSFARKYAGSTTPVERHEYVYSTYRGRKLRVYENALCKLDTAGIKHSNSFISAFVKYEKILSQPKRQVPRLIQPRSPVYNVELGRYLHGIEHSVYRTIDHIFGAPVVMKGLNASQQGVIFQEAWDKFGDPMGLGLDASRFDQHVSIDVLSWEHSIYDKIFRGDPWLRTLLRWQLKTRGFMRVDGATISYGVEGGRCSGDMNTAMGNVLIMCAMVYAFLDENGALHRVRVLDAGDDCMFIAERSTILRLAPLIKPFFERFGFIMKVEVPVEVLEKVSFCQTQPVYDGLTYRMVRDPRVSMSKDSILLNSGYVSNLSTHCSAIGKCGLSLTGGLPILQDYYSALISKDFQGGESPEDYLPDTGFVRLARGMHERYRPVTDEARVSFYRAFDIVPDLQCALEEQLRATPAPAGPVGDEEIVRLPV